MNGLELLKKNPKASIVVKQWYLEKMLENLKDESLPENFKEMVREQGIDEDKIAIFINSSPRALFDVFDKHKLFISVVYLNNAFTWRINSAENKNSYQNRKDAELDAIVEAFKQLETKL